jgi:hypothetical protein
VGTPLARHDFHNHAGLPVRALGCWERTNPRAMPRTDQIVEQVFMEAAERRYAKAAGDFGCPVVAARTYVSDVMRDLRTEVETVAA